MSKQDRQSLKGYISTNQHIHGKTNWGAVIVDLALLGVSVYSKNYWLLIGWGFTGGYWK